MPLSQSMGIKCSNIMSKKALIFGVTGQDGALLTRFLLDKGYQVAGAARSELNADYANLTATAVFDQVEIWHVSLLDKSAVKDLLIEIKPDEIYNLSGQSSVGLSFTCPVETFESHALATLNLLEAIRLSGSPIKLFNAGSGECFGDTRGKPANESTSFYPRSPYAVAKTAAFWEVVNYREVYGLFSCTGILFNHESPLRPTRFVTSKIVRAASRIADSSKEQLTLGDLSIRRDWGWAAEYVDAMWRMLQLQEPEDFVIATGQSNSLESFVAEAFACVGLNWREHVKLDEDLLRPSEIPEIKGDASKARKKLGWTAKFHMSEVIKKMMDLNHE